MDIPPNFDIGYFFRIVYKNTQIDSGRLSFFVPFSLNEEAPSLI